MRAQRARAAMMMPAVAPAPSLRVGGGVCGTLLMMPGPVEFVLLREGMAIICCGMLFWNMAWETLN